MTNPFLKSILTWRSFVMDRKGSRERRDSNRLNRTKSYGSEASDTSDSTNEASPHRKQNNSTEHMCSPSFRTMRRHAICEENLREYYMFWCVNSNNSEDSQHYHHHNYHRHQHQSNQLDRKQT